MEPSALMSGPLEPTNEAYATAKLAGIALCHAYRKQHGLNTISAIPSDIFGPGDDFSPEDSHVVAGLIRRMHDAKIFHMPHIDLWGTGMVYREFIYVDDLASACVFAMRNYDGATVLNIGSGTEYTILQLARTVKEVVGYPGVLRFDAAKPDGMGRKLLDSSRLKTMGWSPKTPFREALEATYAW